VGAELFLADGQTDGPTDRHYKANSDFSQLRNLVYTTHKFIRAFEKMPLLLNKDIIIPCLITYLYARTSPRYVGL